MDGDPDISGVASNLLQVITFITVHRLGSDSTSELVLVTSAARVKRLS